MTSDISDKKIIRHQVRHINKLRGISINEALNDETSKISKIKNEVSQKDVEENKTNTVLDNFLDDLVAR